MSVRNQQIENALVDIVRLLYSTGVKPTLNDILEMTSMYFSQYPAGNPLPLPLDSVRGGTRSNVNDMNRIMSTMDVNLDLLYEVSQEQVQEVMDLTTELNSYISRLSAMRKRIETTVDDYLLSLYNSDGYYYSISDTFADLSLVDLTLTSLYVDAEQGKVQLPTISSMSTKIAPEKVASPNITVASSLPNTPQFRTIAPWSGAVDGLTNTVWSIELETTSPAEVVCTIELPFGDPGQEISRIEIDPYGITEAQYWVNVTTPTDQANPINENFGDKIVTSHSRFSLVDTPQEFDLCTINIRKTLHDYTDQSTGVLKYRYVFGLKDLAFTVQTYDNSGTVISQPLSVPGELANQYIIDAVSITANADIPPDTSVNYYLAEDTGGSEISDFNWKRVVPVDSTGNVAGALKVVRFNGTRTFVKDVVANPDPNDLQLIPQDLVNSDLTKRNPSPVIIPGTDVWRLAPFDDESALLPSMVLEEGVNTVRYYHTTYDPAAVASLDWWITRLPALSPGYARIDSGNDFFYGGEIGESNRSVFMETYVDIPEQIDPIHSEFRKTDPNSQSWAVRIFLNGRDIGYLPVGTDKALIPYTFQQGRNNITIIAIIPPATSAVPNPYIGTLDLMSEADLYDYGVVKLATWNYVDLFDMTYNQDDQPYTFTITNEEIVSRRKPTTNFRVTYASATQQGPEAIRFRADMARGVDNKHITPSLDQYRLRFSYSE
jgi:hypothetical protein